MAAVVSAPASISELMERAHSLAGCSLMQLAAQVDFSLPDDLLQLKGSIGQLLELCLGADAGCLAQPDFTQLGVELKTIPVNNQGKPMESTYVTVVPLTNLLGLTWENSEVRMKLAQVLWIPVQGEHRIPLAQRRVGFPILWRGRVRENYCKIRHRAADPP